MTAAPFTPPASLGRAQRRVLARTAGRLALAAATGADERAAARAVAGTLEAYDDPAAEAVVRWAEAEGVAALIASTLGPLAPAAVADGLADTARRVAQRSAVLAADRGRMAVALASAGVPWRPLKGAWLADHAYPDPALRPMADTDLWVPSAHARAAHAALSGMGYRLTSTSWKHASYALPGATVVDRRGEHPDNPRPVEVHPRILEGFRGLTLDVGALLASPEAAAARPVDPWPDEAMMLLHVAAHATVDALGRRLRLLSLVDVGVVAARATDRTWQRVIDAAATPHAARFIWPALCLAAREIDAPVPCTVLEVLARSVRVPLLRWADDVDIDQVSRAGSATARRPLLEIPRMWPRNAREAGTVLRWICWPPRSALADRYPRLASSPRWPLAYALHVADSWRVARHRWRVRVR